MSINESPASWYARTMKEARDRIDSIYRTSDDKLFDPSEYGKGELAKMTALKEAMEHQKKLNIKRG